jgi:hypothetical protein
MTYAIWLKFLRQDFAIRRPVIKGYEVVAKSQSKRVMEEAMGGVSVYRNRDEAKRQRK